MVLVSLIPKWMINWTLHTKWRNRQEHIIHSSTTSPNVTIWGTNILTSHINLTDPTQPKFLPQQTYSYQFWQNVNDPAKPTRKQTKNPSRAFDAMVSLLSIHSVSPHTRLAPFIKTWARVTTDSWVLSINANGYTIEFIETPPKNHLHTHLSYLAKRNPSS